MFYLNIRSYLSGNCYLFCERKTHDDGIEGEEDNAKLEARGRGRFDWLWRVYRAVA
mgnify:CR=1 FL=1